jgi:transposase InsO family protein
MIAQLAKEYPLRPLCEVLEVARSGYYRWRQGGSSVRDRANAFLVQEIKSIHKANRGNYGSPRITQQLCQSGHGCNHKRVERLMRQQGLKGRNLQEAQSQDDR